MQALWLILPIFPAKCIYLLFLFLEGFELCFPVFLTFGNRLHIHHIVACTPENKCSLQQSFLPCTCLELWLPAFSHTGGRLHIHQDVACTSHDQRPVQHSPTSIMRKDKDAYRIRESCCMHFVCTHYSLRKLNCAQARKCVHVGEGGRVSRRSVLHHRKIHSVPNFAENPTICGSEYG